MFDSLSYKPARLIRIEDETKLKRLLPQGEEEDREGEEERRKGEKLEPRERRGKGRMTSL